MALRIKYDIESCYGDKLVTKYIQIHGRTQHQDQN